MNSYPATLASVHDGDTFRLNINLGIFRLQLIAAEVRISGYDAPELGRPDKLGETARDFVVTWFNLASKLMIDVLLTDQEVARDDKYGRILVRAVRDIIAERELIADMRFAKLLRPYTGRGPKPWSVT